MKDNNRIMMTILIVIVVLMAIGRAPKIDFFGGKKLFSTLSPEETKTQLKQDYITACSDKTDCSLSEFTSQNTVSQSDTSIQISADFYNSPSRKLLQSTVLVGMLTKEAVH